MAEDGGRRSIVERDDGTEDVPETAEDWRGWIAATATRAWALEDPLLDWFDLHGGDRGFVPDTEVDGYDPRTDFARFVMTKGVEFEEAVVACIADHSEVASLPERQGGARSLEAAEETFDLMCRGVPVIHQGVLRNPQTRTYGAPDLLVRSDVLRELFPTAISDEQAVRPAPAIPDADWHYRVVDVKFTTLDLRAEVDELTTSTWHFQVQLELYNQALARLQGLDPEVSYLLGRGWRQPVEGTTVRGDSCLDKLGAVSHRLVQRGDRSLAEAVEAAADWVRRVRREGEAWEPLPEPSLPELRPNMNNTEDHPWHGAKQHISTELEDLTLLWYIGPDRRDLAADHGITRWTDPGLDAAMVGLRGERARVLDAILEVNRDTHGPPVRSDRIETERDVWGDGDRLEFFVDFETVSDLDDDLSSMPLKGGQPMIFMIGCGHLEDGQWRFECFIADDLTESSEADIIRRWTDHMAATRRLLDTGGDEPIVYHWSPAEVSTLETAHNSARERLPDTSWPEVNWFDFCGRVASAEPVVVRGAFGFGLKQMAKALHRHGLIETGWGEGPADGLGAMAGAWWAAEEAAPHGCRLADVDLMADIAAYNEIDCRVMYETIDYLRSNH